jgi:Amino-transferase class IV
VTCIAHTGLVSNVFIVKVDTQTDAVTVCTAHSNVLHGAIRAVCIQACKQLGYTVDTTDTALLLSEADTWHEMFLTGTINASKFIMYKECMYTCTHTLQSNRNTVEVNCTINSSLTLTRVVFMLIHFLQVLVVY